MSGIAAWCGLLLLAASGCPAPATPKPAAPAPETAPAAPGTSGTATAPAADSKPITILYDGLGDLHHQVTTSSPEAQRFFDQGLRLIYGFNHPEAIRSFREAARLDPSCAMAYWGVAVALGPNYNMPSDPDAENTAREMVTRARALEAKVSPAERDYIEAAALRYAGPVTADRSANDRAYADAMRELAKKYPDDIDASVLFAEAAMDLRPWKLWTPDGSPAPGTEEITSTLEGVLAKHPDHPGANHYYIHAEEAGPHPEKALDAAKRLPGLMPGAGHIVHMPCHIYIHTGMWAEASDANEHAIVADKAYLAKPHAEGIYSMMYVAHNHMFLWFSAGMEGRRDRSVQAAKDLNSLFDTAMVVEMNKSMPGSDYFLAPYYFALVRFGMWKEILAEPAPPAELRYLTAVWHFARAFASARTGNMKQAHDEQAALEHFAAALKDDEMVGPLNSAKAVFGVATQLLAGELEAAAGHRKNAIALEKEAVKREVALGYDEPPPWPLSTRQYLGALLLEDHRAADAIAVYQADLAKYPENGWSLFGLAEAYKQRKAHEEKSVRDRFTKAWAHADVTLASSRF